MAAFVFVVIFLWHPLAELIERTVRDAYSGTSIGLVNEYFRRIAQHANSLPADAYIAKAMALYNRARWAVGLLILPAVPLVLRKLFRRLLQAWVLTGFGVWFRSWSQECSWVWRHRSGSPAP